MAENEPHHEPHRPNYAELKNEHAEAHQREQQQQEAAPEPTRPEGPVRAAGWTDRGDMASQQRSATEHAQKANEQAQSNWKGALKTRHPLRRMMQGH